MVGGCDGRLPMRPGTGFYGEENRSLPPPPELGQKAMLLSSNILGVPEGYAPDPGFKTLKGAHGEPAIAPLIDLNCFTIQNNPAQILVQPNIRECWSGCRRFPRRRPRTSFYQRDTLNSRGFRRECLNFRKGCGSRINISFDNGQGFICGALEGLKGRFGGGAGFAEG